MSAQEKADIIIAALIKAGITGDKLQRIMGFIDGMTINKEYEKNTRSKE